MLKVEADKPTYLYGGQASSVTGDIKKQAGDNFRWRGNGSLTWEVSVEQPGEYEVNLCHAAEPEAVGQKLEISSGQSRLSYTLAATPGVFGKKSYTLAPIPGSLHLTTGTNTISLGVEGAQATMAVLAFRSLELIPVAAKAAIEADRQEARQARASTEWLAKAGYGLMFHWTSQSVGKDGTNKPFAQAVDDFDVKRFAEMVESTGAGYVLFTVGHAQPYCPAPLASWEKYFPGKTTKRDLIAEMAQALNAKGIKLMCYFPAHVIGKYPKASSEEFTRMTSDIVKEFGERYGEKVAGYWFDGFYQCFEKYPDFSFREFLQGLQSRKPESHHGVELLDLSKRHRMAGVLGRGNLQPRRIAGQRHDPRARPRRGIALPVTAHHGALLGAAEGGNARAAILCTKARRLYQPVQEERRRSDDQSRHLPGRIG